MFIFLGTLMFITNKFLLCVVCFSSIVVATFYECSPGILTYLGVFGATTWHCANRIRKRLPIKGLLWWFYTLLAVFLSSAFFVGCLFTLSARTAWLCMQLFMPPPNSAVRDEMHISVLRASFVLNRLPVVFFTLLYTVLALAW